MVNKPDTKKVVSTKSATTKHAIIQIGSIQHIVKAGQELLVEKINAKPKSSFSIKRVLAIFDEKNKLESLGTPHIKKALRAEVLDQIKGPKIYVIKYKPKTRYRRKTGHRQLLTKIKILDFS